MTTYHLSIHKPCGSYTGMETFSTHEIQLDNEQDYALAKRLCENQKHMAGFWKQTVLPIRTDHPSDLFFPTLMNLVFKTKRAAENCFAVTLAIFWDLVTLPIRLMTFLPRLCYNSLSRIEEHPLIPYLKGKGQVEDVKDGRANVRLYRRKVFEGGSLQVGKIYRLHLSDREISFPTYSSNSFSARFLA